MLILCQLMLDLNVPKSHFPSDKKFDYIPRWYESLFTKCQSSAILKVSFINMSSQQLMVANTSKISSSNNKKKNQNIFNKSPQHRCHWSEMNLTDSSTQIRLLWQSFAVSCGTKNNWQQVWEMNLNLTFWIKLSLTCTGQERSSTVKVYSHL